MTVRFYGEIERLYTKSDGCSIRLQNVTPTGIVMPRDGYFHLDLNHENYAALYSLALLAASGRHRLSIRTTDDAVPTSPANVQYLVLDW
jgi:hypothetical protein